MEYVVSSASIGAMIFDLFMGVMIPVVLFLHLNRKRKMNAKPFFVGWLAFLIVVMILERVFHMLVLNSPIGEAIQSSLFAYAVYGGVIAGLFEELGRYFAFSRFLKKETENDTTAIMYGAGHGGSEMFNLLSITMASNLATALTLNEQGISALTQGLEGSALEQMMTVITQLCNTPSWLFLLSLAERIFALILQISLSVMVFYSVKNPQKDRKLLFLAVELHALVDFLAVLSAQLVPIVISELMIGFMSGFAAWFAYRIWKQNHSIQ